MEIGALKNLPYNQRLELFRQRIKEASQALDVDMTPILAQNPSTIEARILYFDVQNDEMLAKLGLERNKPSEKLSN